MILRLGESQDRLYVLFIVVFQGWDIAGPHKVFAGNMVLC